MRVHGPANFLYSDGEFLYAHGHRRTFGLVGKCIVPLSFRDELLNFLRTVSGSVECPDDGAHAGAGYVIRNATLPAL
jgi:hypothetical protein